MIKVKVSADDQPMIKITKKVSTLRWARFELDYFVWTRLANGFSEVLTNLFAELENRTYEVPNEVKPRGYRWRLIKAKSGQNVVMRSEFFAGPWEENIHRVISNSKEFMRRAKMQNLQYERVAMVIETLTRDGSVKTLGPISTPQMSATSRQSVDMM